jgi:hypothetical protein
MNDVDKEKFLLMLRECIAHHESYLADLLPQAEAYQREVEWMRDRIDALKKLLEIEAPTEEREG